MAVQAQLHRVGRIAADLGEPGAPPRIDEVDGVVVHEHRSAVVGEVHELARDLLGVVPGAGALLVHADQNDAGLPGEPGAVRLHHVVLALPLLEMDPGHCMLGGPGPEFPGRHIRDLTQEGGRRDGVAALQEQADDSTGGLDARDVGIEIDAIDD